MRVYLSQTDVPGQQQDEERALAHLREDQHQSPDGSGVAPRCHQPKTGEARHVHGHVLLAHASRRDEVHFLVGCMNHRQEVVAVLCKAEDLVQGPAVLKLLGQS